LDGHQSFGKYSSRSATAKTLRHVLAAASDRDWVRRRLRAVPRRVHSASDELLKEPTVIEDITITAHEAMSPSHRKGMANGKYAPMRGQAYVRMLEPPVGLVRLTGINPRDQKNHLGEIVALGAPSRLSAHPDSPEVPWDVKVGDKVVFVLGAWLDRMRIMAMLGVTGDVAVVSQTELVAVHD
jgi:hypothetical protein